MSTVLDQTTDLNGQELHRLISVYPLPDYVKEASAEDLCGVEDVPPHLFADMTRRMFPIKNGPSTVLSATFFYEKKAELPSGPAALIEKRLLHAADYFKVRNDVDTLREKVAEALTYDETALPNSSFAIVFDGPDGVKERRCPLRNVTEVKTAAAWLLKTRDTMPFEVRSKIADRILQKAASLGVNISDQRYELEKMAGAGVCAGSDIAEMIRVRIRALGHTHQANELQTELEKLAQICENDPGAIRHYAPLTKIASIVDQFDREQGLHHRYDDVVQRPEDVLFAVTAKAAADLDHELVGSVLTGNYYKRADLQQLPLCDLADSLGDDFVTAVTTADAWLDIEKLAAIVPTLPRGEAEEFDAIASAAGIQPFAQKSASAAQLLPPETQMKLAAVHSPRAGTLWSQLPDHQT